MEHFYVYDNGSEDDILTRLQRYTDAGVVTYIHWPFRPDKGMHWNQVPTLAPAPARFLQTDPTQRDPSAQAEVRPSRTLSSTLFVT